MTKYVAVLATLTVASAQTVPESDAVLEHARQKILAVAHRLPRYTCLETINREYFASPSSGIDDQPLSAYSANDTPRNCPATLHHPADERTVTASDRLRLEVTVDNQGEIESLPGATRFDSRRIDEMVTFGPISTGSFGGYLNGVFENSGTNIAFTRDNRGWPARF